MRHALLFILFSALSCALPAQTAQEFLMPAPDGALLYTAVIAPDGGGKFPVLVERTPYDSKFQTISSLKKSRKRWTDAGYVVVHQHVRGSGKSGGVRYPYDDERRDGLALLDWIRGRDFYNGEIYLDGGSYCASVHISYLDTNPPDVKGVTLRVQDVERYNVVFKNGFFKMGLHGGWYLKEYAKNSAIKRDLNLDKATVFPLTDLSRRVFGESVPQFDAPLLHPDPNDPFWQTPAGGSEYRGAVAKSKIPILLVSSFYDIYTQGIIEMWRGMPAEKRAKCAFIITPYTHNVNRGAVEFPNAAPDKICPDYIVNWFNHIRTGEPLRFAEAGKAKWYTLWENKWHSAPDIANAPKRVEFFLNADRSLGKSPSARGEITYKYDPRNPAKFNGGVCNAFGGMKEQAAPNSRPDIISFVSEPFEENTVAEGAMRVRLRVKSDCPDTCFYVRADIVRSGGKTYSLRDDIDSIRRTHKDYKPGAEVDMEYVFADHSFMFEKGDRLRLDVSSSCVPSFSVHTNRAGNQFTQPDPQTATNTIIAGESSITLFTK